MHETVNRLLLNMYQGRKSTSAEYVLDRKGSEDKTIDYVFGLLDISWWYYEIVAAIVLAVWRIWKKPSLGAFVAYSFLILAETVFTRNPFVGDHLKLEFFWSWKQWNIQKNQILTNVIMFISVGVIAGWLWRWKGLWVAAGLSFFIETLQLVTQRGLMEFDDVIHNCLGAAVGMVIVMMVKRLMRTRERDKV